MTNTQFISISSQQQQLLCFQHDQLWKSYQISTGKNGMGEIKGSECTPRGWHAVYSRLGLEAVINSVFVGRRWTGEIYNEELSVVHPKRDWILTRILQLEGLEPGRNQGGEVDSLQRYIYIHGTPDKTPLGIAGSRGCIRMRNTDIVELADWAQLGTKVFIA